MFWNNFRLQEEIFQRSHMNHKELRVFGQIFRFVRFNFKETIVVFQLKFFKSERFTSSRSARNITCWTNMKNRRFSSKFGQVHPISNVFLMQNHGFRAPSVGRYVLMCVIKISIAPSIKFPWHPQGEMPVYVCIDAKSRKFRENVSIYMIFSSQRFFSSNWNRSSEGVLRLSASILKRFCS